MSETSTRIPTERADKISFLKKKNKVRKALAEKGIMKREGQNTFDRYSYFSEAQYKKLFTELFSACDLELMCEESDITDIEGTDKQPYGKQVRLEFTLIDIDTGFEEVSHSTGEGFDKGDKALYKAKTGALKYWLANNWMVATGDDPETESPENESTPKQRTKPSGGGQKLATEAQLKMIHGLYTDEEIETMLKRLGKADETQFTISEASKMIGARKKAD